MAEQLERQSLEWRINLERERERQRETERERERDRERETVLFYAVWCGDTVTVMSPLAGAPPADQDNQHGDGWLVTLSGPVGLGGQSTHTDHLEVRIYLRYFSLV